jgi:hypothetical protein
MEPLFRTTSCIALSDHVRLIENGARLYANELFLVALQIAGYDNIVDHNLVVTVLFAGTFNGKAEMRLQVDSGIEVQLATDVTFTNNHVACSENAGFRMDGERCSNDGSTGSYTFSGNVAHSSMIGAMLYLPDDGLPPCSAINNVTVYRNYDFGFYAQSQAALKIYNLISIDNGLGLFTLTLGPPSRNHEFKDKYVEVHDSIFVGTSSVYDCDEGHPKAPAWSINNMNRGFRHNDGGPLGMSMATFTSKENGANKHAMAGIMAYQAIRGVMKVDGTTFSKFGNKCTSKSFAVTTPANNDDGIHPLELTNSKIYQTDHKYKVFFSRPRLR